MLLIAKEMSTLQEHVVLLPVFVGICVIWAVILLYCFYLCVCTRS